MNNAFESIFRRALTAEGFVQAAGTNPKSFGKWVLNGAPGLSVQLPYGGIPMEYLILQVGSAGHERGFHRREVFIEPIESFATRLNVEVASMMRGPLVLWQRHKEIDAAVETSQTATLEQDRVKIADALVHCDANEWELIAEDGKIGGVIVMVEVFGHNADAIVAKLKALRAVLDAPTDAMSTPILILCKALDATPTS